MAGKPPKDRETLQTPVLEVRGARLTVKTATIKSPLLDYPHKSYFWIQSITTTSSTQKWPVQALKTKKRDDKLRELLNTPVDVKRRKTAPPIEKHAFEMNQYSLPTCTILSEIYKSQRRTFKEQKDSAVSRCGIDNFQGFFDEPFLYQYLSTAYNKLYGQPIENIKDFSRKFSQRKPAKPVKPRIERRTIRITGVEPQPSIETY